MTCQPATGSSAAADQPGPARVALIAGLMVLVSLSGTMNRDLWTPDEPREAAIALAMSRSGFSAVPELAGKPFVEKPPLFYMAASTCLRVAGPFTGETTALRLTPALFGLGTLLFTYLLGRVFFDRRMALLAAAILATMTGFIHVTHWLLVDNALMFFVVASAWAMARAYSVPPDAVRLPYLCLAGLCAGGAFLSKGAIGPVLLFPAWLLLFVSWASRSGWGVVLAARNLVAHGAALAAAIIFPAAWIILFALEAGPELLREWWWTNHLGRFSGQSTHLGHISPWYYYFGALPVYILPWIVPFILAFKAFFNKVAGRGRGAPGLVFCASWILAAFVLLSLSATKREIYLCVLLPACAVLCIHGMADAMGGRGRLFFLLWLALAFCGAALVLAYPLAALFRPELPSVGAGNLALLAVCAAAAALALFRRNIPFPERFAETNLLLAAGFLLALCPLIDRHKSYGEAFRQTGAAIQSLADARVAGWNLDETTAAGLYYYCNTILPQVRDEQALRNILCGKDSLFGAVLILEKNKAPKSLPESGNEVIFSTFMGKRRVLQLIAAPRQVGAVEVQRNKFK